MTNDSYLGQFREGVRVAESRHRDHPSAVEPLDKHLSETVQRVSTSGPLSRDGRSAI